jgi:hypothetical protein
MLNPLSRSLDSGLSQLLYHSLFTQVFKFRVYPDWWYGKPPKHNEIPALPQDGERPA